jgi:hypothetical protein
LRSYKLARYGLEVAVPNNVPVGNDRLATSREQSHRDWILFLAVLVGIIAAWIGYGWWFIPWLKLEHPGAHGDMFGGLNALFSGLAFAAVVFAIVLQRRELLLQQEELATLIGQSKETANALAQQIELLRLEAIAAATPSFLPHRIENRASSETNPKPHSIFRIELDVREAPGQIPPTIYDVELDGPPGFESEKRAKLGAADSVYVTITPTFNSLAPHGFRLLYRDRIGNDRAAVFEIQKPQHTNSLAIPRFVRHEVIRSVLTTRS